MRYAASRFGEDAIAVGEFVTGSTVTCILYNVDTGATVATTDAICTEISTTGVFIFKLSKVVTKPDAFTQVVYIMTDSSTGRTHKGKVLIGGYPSDAAIDRYQSTIHIDTLGGGTAGTTFPIGTPDTPSSNVADALTIATALGIKSYTVRGAITLTVNHINWEINGFDPDQDIVTINAGVTTTRASFYRMGIRGDLTGVMSAVQCIFGTAVSTVTGIEGVIYDCGVNGTFRIASGGILSSLGLYSIAIGGANLDFNSPGTTVQVLINSLAGYWNIKNGNNRCIMGAVLKGGNVTMGNTNVNFGGAHFYGYGELEYSNATFLSPIADFVLRGSNLDVAVSTVSGAAAWDEPLTSHTTSGTFGWFVQKLLTVAKFLGLK